MKAKNILLTHFSQRYPKVPLVEPTGSNRYSPHRDRKSPTPPETIRSSPAPVALAFDGATLPIGSMWKMARYMDAITETFAETTEPDEDDVLPSEEATTPPRGDFKGKKKPNTPQKTPTQVKRGKSPSRGKQTKTKRPNAQR